MSAETLIYRMKALEDFDEIIEKRNIEGDDTESLLALAVEYHALYNNAVLRLIKENKLESDEYKEFAAKMNLMEFLIVQKAMQLNGYYQTDDTGEWKLKK